MEESETRKSVRWKETTRITPTEEDIITSYLTVSDENQNKLQEAEAMDLQAVKLDLENRNPEESSPTNTKSHSCSLDHGKPFILQYSGALISEGYFLEKDYQWAVEFLHLEKLYHERLLSNLASIQEKWGKDRTISVQTESNPNGTDREREHMELLSHICKTHQSLLLLQNMDDIKLHNCPSLVSKHRKSKQEQASVNSTERENRDCELNEEEEEEEEEDEEGLEEDECWNDELQDDTVVDGQVPADELASLIQVEERFPSDGLVSILKKRVCARETEKDSLLKDSTKRRVRFREPGDAFDQDESARNSCLILLVLCLVTVVISMGGTALYCLVGGAYSNVCADFSQNVDFYFGPVRRGMDALAQWLSSDAS
uniref:Consortin-like n=1 Tax=Sinocyclocheilus grahami TaxID=75366 RepID=A0A672R0B0_SINGR